MEEFFLNLFIAGRDLHYERLGAALAWQSGQDEDACQPTRNPMIYLSAKSMYWSEACTRRRQGFRSAPAHYIAEHFPKSHKKSKTFYPALRLYFVIVFENIFDDETVDILVFSAQPRAQRLPI